MEEANEEPNEKGEGISSNSDTEDEGDENKETKVPSKLLSKCFKCGIIGHATIEYSYEEGKDNGSEEEENFLMSMITNSIDEEDELQIAPGGSKVK